MTSSDSGRYNAVYLFLSAVPTGAVYSSTSTDTGFASAIAVVADVKLRFVVLRDIDGDGDADIVAVDSTGSVLWYQVRPKARRAPCKRRHSTSAVHLI